MTAKENDILSDWSRDLSEGLAENDVEGKITLKNSLKGEEDLAAELNLRLIETFRSEIGYIGMELEWIALKMALTKLALRMSDDFLYFPEVLKYLKRLADKGTAISQISFIEMIDELSLDQKNLEFFLEKLLGMENANSKKIIEHTLFAIQRIEPDTWLEAAWYLELILETNPTVAELTSLAAGHMKAKSQICFYLMLQVAKIGRMEPVEDYIDLVEAVEKKGSNIAEEIRPVVDLIGQKKLAEAEMMLSALLKGFSGDEKIRS